MKYQIIITNGDNEHECIKNDDGSCALCCKQYVNGDGALASDLIKLGMPLIGPHCALDDIEPMAIEDALQDAIDWINDSFRPDEKPEAITKWEEALEEHRRKTEHY